MGLYKELARTMDQTEWHRTWRRLQTEEHVMEDMAYLGVTDTAFSDAFGEFLAADQEATETVLRIAHGRKLTHPYLSDRATRVGCWQE
jgi:hypothetical protein